MSALISSGACSGDELLVEAERLLLDRKLHLGIKIFHRAESVGAASDRCAAGRWMAQMLLGNFPAAWRESDSIRKRGAPDPHRFWNGEPIAGKKIIVRCLHGLGDAVQFLCYAPRLEKIASKVIWEFPPALMEIAPYFCGVHNIVSWNNLLGHGSDWDIQLEIMELSYLFRTCIEELPLEEKYICLPHEVTGPVAHQLGRSTMPRIGLVWQAGEWNPTRSVPFHLFAPVLQSYRCEFWNLQGGAARSEWKRFLDTTCFHEIKACDNGVLSLAAVISQMDLVITVDTLAAHLAGALGVPAWVMLPYAADWRWMTKRNDSPWYSSLRLFRQPSPGDWTSVISFVSRALGRAIDFTGGRLIA